MAKPNSTDTVASMSALHYQRIQAMKEQHSIAQLCVALDVTHSGYRACLRSQKGQASPRSVAESVFTFPAWCAGDFSQAIIGSQFKRATP